MNRVAVATTSQAAADAAAEVADSGGNAVDCALAAALFAMNTEPSVCALAGGAYVTVYVPGHGPVTIDGNVAIPGLGLAPEERGKGAESVMLDYGGGIETLAGAGSVAVPGSLAAIDKAWRHYGAVPWRDILAPTVAAARNGFPLSAACHYYLGYSGLKIFRRSDDGYFALYGRDHALHAVGSPVHIPHLADSLAAIADEGARVFYEGALGAAIVAHVRGRGGSLTRDDLATYEAIERPSLSVDVGGWSVASNPLPAIGGTTLAAMLLACRNLPHSDWRRESLARLIAVQRAVLRYRRERLDLAEDVGAHAAALLRLASETDFPGNWVSSSTVHTSAVDGTGMACAVTASSGYGSGEMPAGTGLWLNNCLGELELNRLGPDAGPPGARLPSNMSPAVARRGSRVLAVGSPGADRITTAMHQFFVNHLQFGMPVEAAIAHPRLHVDTSGEDERLMAEPGLDLPEVEIPVHVTRDISMYFGGVTAAAYDSGRGFEAAADPRREGGTVVTGG